MLNPVHERTERVKHVRARTAAAMVHSRNHEKPGEVLSVLNPVDKGECLLTGDIGLRATDICHHILVIFNRFKRGGSGICPTVVKQQLSSVGPEELEVGLCRRPASCR